jgi:hypothetical protein
MSFVVRVAGFGGVMGDVAVYLECIKHSLLYSTLTTFLVEHYMYDSVLPFIITIIQYPKITS